MAQGFVWTVKKSFWNIWLFLKGRHDDPKSEKSQAFQEFMILLEQARKIIAAMYQEDEEENGGKRSGSLRISVLRIWRKGYLQQDPINKMGNLKRCPHPFWQSISARSASAARGSTIS